MSDSYGKSDTLPLTWFGRAPVYATTILVVLDLIGMFATTLLKTARYSPEQLLGFDAQLFWRDGHLWQFFTAPFVSYPSFFYIFSLFCLYSFGVGIESYLGRRIFLRLLTVLLSISALVPTLWWLFQGAGHYDGNYHIFIGIFVAYATLYPNAEYWNWITMKWLAFAGITLSAMMYLPDHNWPAITSLLAVCAAAFAYIRFERGHWTMPHFSLFRPKPRLRVLPAPVPVKARVGARHAPIETHEAPESEVDALLDKIARSGLASLSPGERAKLERAREDLLKRDRR